VIFEFHGCFWHSCLKCYSDATFNPILQQTMKQINMKHNNRINYIKMKYANYILIELWEHQYNILTKTNDFKAFLESHNLNNNDELKIRNCLYGGRTNAIKLYHNCNDEEYISYIDVTSLYPYVQKYCRYPKGHPIFIYNLDINEFFKTRYFGMIKCSILPPKGLYIPVLPVRLHNKLFFPLCMKCATELNESAICLHSNLERLLNGEWCTEEIYLALEYGYTLHEIYEICHWTDTEMYDPKLKSGGLFTGYINQAMKEKQEASGYPDDCQTDEEKEKYINDFYNAEGIKLDKNKIIKNSGLRFVAKNKANNQWGYLAMNTNKVQHKTIRDINTWLKMLDDDRHIIPNVEIYNSTCPCLQVFFSYNDEFHTGDNKTNVALAAFVTTYGRIHLYKELAKLGKRVLYFTVL
jgi:hypothetical protein